MGFYRSFLSFCFLVLALSLHAQNSKPKFLNGVTFSVSAGIPVSFNLVSSDDDINDSVRIYLVSSQLNGTLNVNNGNAKHASGTFTIYTSLNDASHTSYKVNFIAVDNAQQPDTAFLTVNIHVFGQPAIHALYKNEIGCGLWTFTMDVNSWTDNFSYLVKDSLGYSVASGQKLSDTLFLTAGKYTVRYALSSNVPVTKVYYDSIEIHEGAKPKIVGPNKVCAFSNTSYQAEFVSKEKVVLSTWVLDNKQQIEVLDSNSAMVDVWLEGSSTLFYYVQTDKCIYQDSKSIIADPCLGINEQSAKEIKVFPNPGISYIQIEVPESGQLQILSSLGQIVQEFNIAEGINSLDINDLSTGAYWLILRSPEGITYRSKIIKAN